MKKLTKVLALGTLVAMANGAGAITTDGDWSDWFSYGGNVNNNNWQEGLVSIHDISTRTQVDEEGPTPGVGGQLYDIEQIFYRYEDADVNALTGGRLHIGLVTGFPAEGVPADSLYAGDMFVDFGNTGGGAQGEFFDVAIATSLRNNAADAARYGHLWLNDGPSSWATEDVIYPQFGTSNPYRVNENVVPQPSDRTAIWNTQVAWGSMGTHNFLEISFDVADFFEDALTNENNGGLGLHWTMECGNDVINVQDNTPLAPVPEPSTFALLGMGVLGGVLRKKFTA